MLEIFNNFDPTFFLSPFVMWQIGVLVLLALAYTAWVDAKTGMVPTFPLLVAGALLLGAVTLRDFQDWDSPMPLVRMIVPGLAFYIAIWSLNHMWRLLFRRDALGMGDASWSFLACIAYGWRPVLFAWGAGAIIALLYMGARRLMDRMAGEVYFVPFLLAGLLIERLVIMPWPSLGLPGLPLQ